MFCVVYLFEVKPESTNTFLEVWDTLTVAIRNHCDSLGSRLHHEKDNRYIAYAQWPNKELLDNSVLPKIFDKELKLLKDSCHKIERLHALNVVNDQLKKQ